MIVALDLLGLGIVRLEFLELLGPQMRRGVANLVGAHQSADFGQAILRTEIGIGVAAAKSSRFAVQRVERCVKGGNVFHSITSDGIWRHGFQIFA
jgi:hypothetical protein